MPTGIIESLDHEARGITRLEGKTIFVEGALPGEEVEYVSFRKKPSFEVAYAQRILKASGQNEAFGMGMKKDMEINAASPLIKKLAELSEGEPEFAKDLVEQIYDNALIQAGLLVNPMEMVQRNYRILDRAAGSR